MTLRTTRHAGARKCLIVLYGLLYSAVGWSQPAQPLLQGQTENVEFDPIRCWWRTSTGAVRTGETFSVVLTCAVLDTDAVQVIPDETRLGVSVIQMLPFELVGGSHPPDLRDRQRRFLQYEYAIRAMSPDLIGQDVPLPDLEVQYRVNSRVPGNASQEGRELSYLLPPQSVRVISMVPDDEVDIRDTSDESFGRVEALLSRAGILDVVAMTFIGLGVVVAAFAFVGLFNLRRSKARPGARPLTDHTVASLAAHELSAVQSEAEQHEWNDALVGRALAATRIAAACVLERPISQHPAEPGAHSEDGCVLRHSLWHRGVWTAVSSAITARDVGHAIKRLPSAVGPVHRQMLDDIQAALTTFSTALYSRQADGNREAFDTATATVADHVHRLRLRRLWSAEALRRWIMRPPEPERQS